MGRSIEGLAPEERIKLYLQYADEAEARAIAASDQSVRAGFSGMSKAWRILAQQLEHQLAYRTPPRFCAKDTNEEQWH